MSEQVPPHDLDAEAAVLSALLLDPTITDDVRGVLPNPASMFSEAHRRVLEAVYELTDARAHVNTVAVGSWLRERGRIEQVGGMAYIVELLNGAPAITIAAVRGYAETVARTERLRSLLGLAHDTVARCYAGGSEAEGLIERVAAQVSKLADARPTDSLRTMSDVVAAAHAEQTEMCERVKTGDTPGFPSTLRITNKTLGGWHRGELTVLAARPGMGKSSFAFQELIGVAKCGFAAVGFSLEMRATQIAKRIIAAEGKVSGWCIRQGVMGAEEWRRFTETCERLARVGCYLEDRPNMTVPEMRARVRRVQREQDRRVGLVVVDYIQLASASQRHGNREQEIAEITRSLKGMALELEVPVIAISQLSRAVESRSDKHPQLSDLRESGAIEQDADAVLFLYRDDYYTTPSKTPGVVDIDVAKQRNGPTGMIHAGWHADTMHFYDVDEAS